MFQIDVERHKKIFLIGIGGCGVSAIGKILSQMGFDVFGSDIKESSNTIRLRDMGIKVFIEHNASHLRDADLVVYSSAISKDNVEFREAQSRNIPIIKRAEMLSWIMDRFQYRIAIAGTHGKTTTTSMLSKIFLDAGLDPTFLIGAETDYVDGSARLGKGLYAIAEADESDGSFLELNPNIIVITNIEPDHMEYFGTEENLNRVFDKFIGKTSKDGFLVLGIDTPYTYEISKQSPIKTITYGEHPSAQVQALDITSDNKGTSFRVVYKEKDLGEAHLAVLGLQNVSNALASIVVGLEAGIPFSSIVSSLHSFSGARRRFQVVGEVNNIIIIDDYAHHPTEIKATLSAARLGWGKEKRIIAIFQPHRYTRTLALFNQFGNAFLDADLVVLTDIYSAGELPIQNVDGTLIANEVTKNQDAIYIPRKEKIPEMLVKNLKKDDIVIIMGAGDINTIAKELISRLKIKNQ